MARKILFFGITGIDKQKCLQKFADWAKRTHKREFKVFDFERDFLFTERYGGSCGEFLDSPQHMQHRIWQRAWLDFERAIAQYENEPSALDLLISLHGCVVRGHYGARTLLQPDLVAKLSPDRIVTLLDNVYDLWWRTTRRAVIASQGNPTLEQLLLARRVEVLVADQLAFRSSHSTQPIKNLVLSVHHPCETLWNWLYSEAPRVVYLCFPISAPRRLLNSKARDATGQEAINDFLRQAYAQQSAQADFVPICPLTIDELPLRDSRDTKRRHIDLIDDHGKPVLDDDGEPVKVVDFDREKLHWNLGGEDSWKTKAIPESFFHRSRYAFQLCSNPTKKVTKELPGGKPTKNGRRVPLSRREDLLNWISRKGVQGGFAVDTSALRCFSRGRDYFQKKGQTGLHSAVEFQGTLTVTDPVVFHETFSRGVGSAKAFGFGLLVIVPVR